MVRLIKPNTLEALMTFTPYQQAVVAAKNAVIEALKIDEKEQTLSELWRHYMGLRAIEQQNQHTELDDNKTASESITFNVKDNFGSDPFTMENPYIPLDIGDTNLAADTVTVGTGLLGGMGQDHITFS